MVCLFPIPVGIRSLVRMMGQSGLVMEGSTSKTKKGGKKGSERFEHYEYMMDKVYRFALVILLRILIDC